MKSLKFFFLLIVFTTSISEAQNATIRELEAKAYQTKAQWFLKLPQFDFDSSYIYFDKAINVLKSNEVVHFQALSEAYFNLYYYLNRLDRSPKIQICLEKAISYFNKISVKSEATKLLEYNILIAEASKFTDKGEQEQANKLLVEAFSWIQEQKSPDLQAQYYYDKGNSYNRLPTDDAKLSKGYLLQAKKLYEAGTSPQKNERLFYVYRRLGAIAYMNENTDSCDYYYDKVKALLPLINNPFFTGSYSSLRANNYLRRKKDEIAKPLLNECENLFEKYKLTQNEVYIFNTYLQGVREIEYKNYDKAIQFINKGLTIAKSLNNKLFTNDGYHNLILAYQSKGDYKKSFEYQNEQMKAMFKEYSETLSNSLKENELKLDIVKKNNEIEQKAKEQKWFIGALLLGLFLLVLVYRNFRQKQKSNLQLESLNQTLATKNSLLDKRNAENELLLKEIHHRVKNNLEVVSSLLALQSAKIDDPEIQDAMLASQNRVQSMGILHQKLYQSEHLAFIEMKNYFQNLCENILDSYNETERISVDIDMKQVELDVDTAVPVGLIVNELLTNSLKYAFPNGEKGKIKLSLENVDKDNLSLKISDNGIGKSINAQAKGTGFGTQLVDLLTKQIDGKLLQEVHNGTIISINFKRQMAA